MPGYASFIDYIINNRPASHGTQRNWLYSQFVLQLLLESFLSILYCAGVFQKDKRKRMSGVLFLSDILPNLPKSS